MREGNVTIYVKEHEAVDRAFKRFKRKCEKIKLSRKIKERMHYQKPSRKRREQLIKAIYKNKMFPKG